MSVVEKLYSEFNESMISNSIRSESCDDSWMPSAPFNLPAQFLDSQYQSWVMALAASVLVGLSGIVPLLIIPVDSTASLKNGTGAKTLRVLLSFAVGGLLGDVFLHLLPEAWESRSSQSAAFTTGNPSIFCGMWVLAGLLAFIIIEKVFTFEKEDDEEEESEKKFAEDTKLNVPAPIKRKRSSFMLDKASVNFEDSYDDYLVNNNNGEEPKLHAVAKKATNSRDISGYLNLMANMIDNFTHGLAVGGSFMLSTRVGVFTTFAILVHEIPHEVGDFAILLRAGFSRWDAAWAQLYTASAGILGAFTALMFNSSANDIEARTSWILPFTAGGFLHIALVTVLPELLDEKNPKESLKQMCSLASGITVMAILTSLVEG